MLAWRLCRAPFTDLTGEGARRYGRRWNRPGRPMVYAASSAALAVLEIRVHLDLPPELLPARWTGARATQLFAERHELWLGDARREWKRLNADA